MQQHNTLVCFEFSFMALSVLVPNMLTPHVDFNMPFLVLLLCFSLKTRKSEAHLKWLTLSDIFCNQISLSTQQGSLLQAFLIPCTTPQVESSVDPDTGESGDRGWAGKSGHCK